MANVITKIYGYSYSYNSHVSKCEVYNMFKTIEDMEKWKHSHIEDTMMFEAYTINNFKGKDEVVVFDYCYTKYPHKVFFCYDKKEEKTYKYDKTKDMWCEYWDNFPVNL